MGTTTDGRQFDSSRPIVAFDFDGTLTIRDSFLSFLAFQAGPVAHVLGLIRLIPATIAYLFHRDRSRLKSAAATVFLGGMTAQAIDAAAERFAEAAAPRLLRPDARQAWDDWKASGAVMTIVTASPELTVAPFARRLGADVLIGTGLEADAVGRITGKFSTENCRAAEKVRRLKAWFGDDMVLAAAYGDTSGDHEMLEMAAIRGYRVFHGKP